MIVEGMAGSNLVEMYGDDAAELMGFSIGKAFKKVGRVTKNIVKSPGRILAVAAAPVTGGASLLAMKSTRDAVGSSARFTQKKILRPVGGAAMTVGRNPMVQKVAGAAARAGAAYVTGGASEAALLAAKSAKGLGARRPALPKSAASAASFAPGTINTGALFKRLSRAGRAAGQAALDTALPAPVETAEAPKGVSMPMILGIGGGAAALLVLAVAMSKKGG